MERAPNIAENGWYNTITDISEFNENARVKNGDQVLTGDSLYYERKNGYGQAFRNVQVIDTVQDVVVNGQYALYQKSLGYTLITEKPEALFIDKGDTLFMRSNHPGQLSTRLRKTKKFCVLHKCCRSDVQGMCKPLVYA